MAEKRGPAKDMLKLQQTIMQNSQGITDYVSELNSWTTEIKQKEKTTVYSGKSGTSSKPVQVGTYFWNVRDLTWLY